MKKALSRLIIGSLLILFFVCGIISNVKAQTSAEKIRGGSKMENAVAIAPNRIYEAEVSLEPDEYGEYYAEAWYKCELPQYAHHVVLRMEESDVNGFEDNCAYLYNQYGNRMTSDSDFYKVDRGDSCYVKVVITDPERFRFELLAVNNPSQDDNLTLSFNRGYQETFYMSVSSYYCFTAPYTGKYRIFCDFQQGEDADYSVFYYTGQEVDSGVFQKDGSSVVQLKEGIKYVIRFGPSDSFYGESDETIGDPVIATFYVSDQSVDSITVADQAITLHKAEQYQIAPVVLPERAVDPRVTYRTSDKKVALVSKDGCITAVGAGTATITVDSRDGSGVLTTCTVKVPATKVTRLDLNLEKLIITKKKSSPWKITAKTYPTKADDRSVTFKSSNSKIISVNEKTGELTPKKAGSAVITCTTNDGSKLTKKCKVIVKTSYFTKHK